MNNNIQKANQNILLWILAHSQVAQSLVDAWDHFNQIIEDPDDQKKKQEIEKAIGIIVQDIWLKKLEELRQRDQNQQNQNIFQMNGDCENYNIHQEENQELELRDVTLWKLTLKNFKLGDNQNKTNLRAQLRALEHCPKDKEKKKDKQNPSKKVIKKKIKK